eukprot:gb/GECG01012881.1/.p1 GENE.gb/GECG01012881.1/~~gb/GECG01012881.1/.p1  ORF type:complete len:238 (+),score=26.07 gb/GECG01012881.1/:1-714(+)
MSLLENNTAARKRYLETLLEPLNIEGSHDSRKKTATRNRLGVLMESLKEAEEYPARDEAPPLLSEIYQELKPGMQLEEFLEQYDVYKRLLSVRQEHIESSWLMENVKTLADENWILWGSYRQFLSGKCITDALNEKHNVDLHPVWGCLLLPTGGIIGPGNWRLHNWLPKGKCTPAVAFHTCVHDASGYLLKYHRLGPGYNYLNTWGTLFPTQVSFSTQVAGIRYWCKLLRRRPGISL